MKYLYVLAALSFFTLSLTAQDLGIMHQEHAQQIFPKTSPLSASRNACMPVLDSFIHWGNLSVTKFIIEREDYEYDTDFRLLRVTSRMPNSAFPDSLYVNAIQSYIYPGASPLYSEYLYQYFEESALAPVSQVKSLWEYDALGLPSLVDHYRWENNDWIKNQRGFTDRYQDSSYKVLATWDWNVNTNTWDSTSYRTFTQSQLPIVDIRHNSFMHRYFYNASERIDSSISFDYQNGSYNPDRKHSYFYDSNGRLVKELEENLNASTQPVPFEQKIHIWHNNQDVADTIKIYAFLQQNWELSQVIANAKLTNGGYEKMEYKIENGQAFLIRHEYQKNNSDGQLIEKLIKHKSLFNPSGPFFVWDLEKRSYDQDKNPNLYEYFEWDSNLNYYRLYRSSVVTYLAPMVRDSSVSRSFTTQNNTMPNQIYTSKYSDELPNTLIKLSLDVPTINGTFERAWTKNYYYRDCSSSPTVAVIEKSKPCRLPSPFSNGQSVQCADNQEVKRIQLFDLAGRLCHTEMQANQGNPLTFPVNMGLYLAVFEMKHGERFVQKIFVE